MSATPMTLEVELRKETGKNAANRIRMAGRIPAVLYGGGKETVSITVNRKSLQDHFRAGARDNSVFLLQMAGTDQKRHAMIREITVDPVSRLMRHLDFIRVDMDHKVRVRVPIQLENTASAQGVKADGGILDFPTREVEIDCLPGDIPEKFVVDVFGLGMNQFLRLSDIGIDQAKFRIHGDTERVVVSIHHARKEEEVAVEGAATTAEPEVIKKGKKEEEGAAPAAGAKGAAAKPAAKK